MVKRTSISVSAIPRKIFKFGWIAATFLFLSSSLNSLASEHKGSDKINPDDKTSTEISAQGKGRNETEAPEVGRESIFGGNRPLDNSHFTWGADVGASLDLTAHDMSTFDLDVIIGYKNKFLKTAGIGVGIHRTVQGGDHFIPLYALVRTSFTSRPSLLFLNARIGYSFNTVDDSPMFGDFNSALGCGINLSQSKKAKTYIIVSAAYRYFNKRHQDYIARLDTYSIWMAQLQFGINF